MKKIQVVYVDGEALWVHENHTLTFTRKSVNTVNIEFKDDHGRDQSVNIDMVMEIKLA